MNYVRKPNECFMRSNTMSTNVGCIYQSKCPGQMHCSQVELQLVIASLSDNEDETFEKSLKVNQ